MILYFSKNLAVSGADATRILSDMPPRLPGGWTKGDRLFVRDSLAHGISVAEVAQFLGRTEKEVRDKARELNE
jgi:hypothetical protein